MRAAAALQGATTAHFSASNTGCGVKSVDAALAFTSDATQGGAPGRRVVLTYDVQLGPLYLRKGHKSWSGRHDVFAQRCADDDES